MAFLLLHNYKDFIQKCPEYLKRIEKYFDFIFIDEVQDLTSDDFDWILSLAKLNIPVLGVGDFYQATFFSSRRGNKNKSLFADYEEYKSRIEKAGYYFDDTSLKVSRRCNKSISTFIKENLYIDMESAKDSCESEKAITFLNDADEIEKILDDDAIIKLFFRNSNKYSCWSDNWGNCKGCTYPTVCVVLNDTTYKLYKNNDLASLKPTSLSKFYVACTRTSGKLYFLEEKKINKRYKIC